MHQHYFALVVLIPALWTACSGDASDGASSADTGGWGSGDGDGEGDGDGDAEEGTEDEGEPDPDEGMPVCDMDTPVTLP
jgi:hypothetical protein